MSPSIDSTPDSNVDSADRATWPWQCLDCRTTIYDDRDYCRDCGVAHSLAESDTRLSGRQSLTEWMRSQSYPTFMVKVSFVSVAELALTALWLQAMLLGPSDLLRGLLVFGW